VSDATRVDRATVGDVGAAPLRVACWQIASPDAEPRRDRIERVLRGLEHVDDVDLVVLPELWATGYFGFDAYQADAETLDGEFVRSLADMAVSKRCYVHVGSFVERSPTGWANSAVLLDPHGAVVLMYRKIHLFGYQSREAQLLTPGDDVAVAATPFGVIGTTTCYDLRFPELYRLLLDLGAELIVVPAAWPEARRAHWDALVRARAIEAQAFVVAVNAAGAQGGVQLAGASTIVDPAGHVLEQVGRDETWMRADLDLGRLRTLRAEFPVLDHRRIDVGPVRPWPAGS
jgi:predicted amidohydrolase